MSRADVGVEEDRNLFLRWSVSGGYGSEHEQQGREGCGSDGQVTCHGVSRVEISPLVLRQQNRVRVR